MYVFIDSLPLIVVFGCGYDRDGFVDSVHVFSDVSLWISHGWLV